MKPYLHDYSEQTSNISNHPSDGYTYFENNDPRVATFADKLYINVKGSENLKTKQDVENFINSDHTDRTVIMVTSRDASQREKIIGFYDVDPENFTTARGFITTFGAKLQLLSDDEQIVEQGFEYLADHNFVGASVGSCPANPKTADACLLGARDRKNL
ncbi:MAG: hypothetical protein LBI63_06180 [Candidatus Ancillula sp.]|nr:hypothetical protein [Candidatus Ancillula sp.]